MSLPLDQVVVFGTLLGALILFMWGRLRYDIVALLALLAVVVTGIIPADEAFFGFAHPAVIIVASMFVLSQALVSSGIVEVITRRFSGLEGHPLRQLLVLSAFVALASAFLANVGALAFSIPIAIKMARESDVSPAMFLMPVAFASHLGAFLTLIGSPRNVIISGFREEATGTAFGLFDFATIGGGVIVVGVLFLALVGWRLIPKRKSGADKTSLFEVENYLTEVLVPEGAPAVGRTLTELTEAADVQATFVSLTRDGRQTSYPRFSQVLQVGDVLRIQDDADSLTELVEANGLELTGERAVESGIESDDETVSVEAVVNPGSMLVGSSWRDVPLNIRYGVNLLAISRSGGQLDKKLDDVRFSASDVILLRGREESVDYTLEALDCLPLESRNLSFGRTRKMAGTLGIFALAVLAAGLGLMDVHVIFFIAAVAAVLFGLVGLKEAYSSVDWPVIMLLGAIIGFGQALVDSGGADQIAQAILSLAAYTTPTMMVLVALIVTSLLADFVNSNVAAVIMAPVAIMIAGLLTASVDPFLMAVMVGANMAFLTPTAHESNTLVMGPGGYKYRDFWKIGLPLEILVITVSMPLILYFWPLYPDNPGPLSSPTPIVEATELPACQSSDVSLLSYHFSHE